MAALATTLVTTVTLAALGGGAGNEKAVRVPMLLGGCFTEQPTGDEDTPRTAWWRLHDGARVKREGDTSWLVTEGHASADQPVPAFAPLVEGLLIRGHVRGAGVLTVVDGGGRRAALELNSHGEDLAFEWTGTVIAESMGSPPVPRLVVELSAFDGGSAAWTGLEALVPMPCPGESELRVEVVERLHDVIDPWLERGLDTVGPRQTHFATVLFDAVTGERISTYPSGLHPLFEILLDAVPLEPVPEWEAALDCYLEDFLTLGIHPETGLPRVWDPEADRPLDEQFVEIHASLRFLLNVAERGPEPFRERALAAAQRMGETALAHGVLPDGNVAPLFRPSDARATNEARPLRRLDLPAQFARLGSQGGDPQLVGAARYAVATFLYTHHWPGTWNRIDPGFDDYFGYYGARAVVMATNYPEDPVFRRVVETGWEWYAPLWSDALRFGGSMAADQVRCWELLLAYAPIHRSMREQLDLLLEQAVHSHLKGQQYGNGAWGDVTYYAFDPAVDLQVGDLPGMPANLLRGLALVYESGCGPPDEETRAIFTAVLLSSASTYRREYGYLSTLREVEGVNHAGGSLRFGAALTILLEKL